MTSAEFDKELARLEERFSTLTAELELTVTDPELGVEGYVVVWSTRNAVHGPLGRVGKGGTRITPTVTLDEVRMLAKTMSLKNAAAGLPLGGAKSGMKGDPDSPGFERKYRRFVSLVAPILKERGGIFGGFGFDIGARPIHPIWACDELKSTRSFTGKPLSMGGTDYDKEGIAGLGVATAACALLEDQKKGVAGISCAVQGLGAMGAAVYRYMHEAGAHMAAVSDPRIGGTYKITSDQAAALYPMIKDQKLDEVRRFLEREKISAYSIEEVLYSEVEILFPCALQGVINELNQGKIKAHAVVEGANNPLDEVARTLLWRRGITVIPDFIANPGGIIAAFVEMTSSVSPEENVRTRKNVDDAKALTKAKISENVRKVLARSKHLGVEPVRVAREIALKSILGEG